MPAAPPAPAVAALDLDAIRARVRNETTRLNCSGVTAQVESNRNVVVEGFVQSDQDRAELDRTLASIPGVARVQMRLAVHPWPVCEAMQMVARVASPDLRITPNLAGQPYRIGRDNLSWRVESASGMSGFAMSVVINSDGTVYQPSEWSQVQVTGGRPLRFLEPDGVPIGPPPGQMALVTFVSPRPFFGQSRPEDEPAQTFFQAVRQAIAGQNGVIGAIAVIDTTP